MSARCSCGLGSIRCALDASHDDRVLAREARGSAGANLGLSALDAARLISEAEAIRAERSRK